MSDIDWRATASDLRQALENKNAEIERLQDDKAAISDTASHYLHEIERLRAALETIAAHNCLWSDFPHSMKNLQRYARDNVRPPVSEAG